MCTDFTSVEKAYIGSTRHRFQSNVPYITVENFPKLGKLTAFRFLEWAAEHPDGVISLPTGKTPEYFIAWVKKILTEWDTKEGAASRAESGLTVTRKPDLRGLHFVQIDEFYPIDPKQHNSFYNYVQKYYVEDFGLDATKGLFINCDEIPLADGMNFRDVFPDGVIDLSLRYREAKSAAEKLRQRSIFMIDNWCSEYDQKVRDLGGIGFFLGGIGPDGHIAFNVRGSDPNSTTRLTHTNYETQAAAASDLGGIEVSRIKPVITIGLETITHNPDAVAIIFAAGEAKAPVVADALEKTPCNLYPASVLSKLPNARFYLTTGAASMLHESVYHYYADSPWTQEKTDRAVIDCCNRLNKYGDKVTLEDLRADEYCSMIPDLNEHTMDSVISSLTKKIARGTSTWSNVLLHRPSSRRHPARSAAPYPQGLQERDQRVAFLDHDIRFQRRHQQVPGQRS